MKEKCSCEKEGWCERHQMQKMGRLFELCKLDNDLGRRYRELWDRKVQESKMPVFTRQVFNFLKAITRHVVDGLKNVGEEEYKNRIEICNGCDSNIEGKCKECGCPIDKKAKWASEDCPLKKWIKKSNDRGCGCGS